MTRARRDSTTHDLIVSLVNWQLFELPGVNLEDIEIPIRRYRSGEFPTQDDVVAMAESIRQTLPLVASSAHSAFLAHIEQTLKAITIDPRKIDTFFNAPSVFEEGDVPLSLRDGGCGTHFQIGRAHV